MVGNVTQFWKWLYRHPIVQSNFLYILSKISQFSQAISSSSKQNCAVVNTIFYKYEKLCLASWINRAMSFLRLSSIHIAPIHFHCGFVLQVLCHIYFDCFSTIECFTKEIETCIKSKHRRMLEIRKHVVIEVMKAHCQLTISIKLRQSGDWGCDTEIECDKEWEKKGFLFCWSMLFYAFRHFHTLLV